MFVPTGFSPEIAGILPPEHLKECDNSFQGCRRLRQEILRAGPDVVFFPAIDGLRWAGYLPIAMDYKLFLRANDGLRAQFVPLPIVGMRTGGQCVKNIANTLHESKRAQIKNQALPIWISEVDFLLQAGRVYLGMMAHLALDLFASKINGPCRKMLA